MSKTALQFIKGVFAINLVTLIVQALGTAVTGFAQYIPEALVTAFDSAFITGTGETLAMTNLLSGLLAIVGISICVGVVAKVWHIFSARIRKSA